MLNQREEIGVRSWTCCYSCMVAVAWVLNFPGRLMQDSSDMLLQARYVENISDWHSLIVTWIYSILSPPIDQPAGALLVQCLILFPYPAALLADKSRNRVLSLALNAALIALSGYIAKDVIMAGVVLCLLGALDYLKGAWRICAAMMAIVFILLVRPTNFLIIFFPAGLWAIYTFRGWRRAKVLAGIAVISLAVIPATAALNKYVFKARSAFPEQSLIIFDIAGMSNNLHRDLFTTLPSWPDNLSKPWDCYTPLRWDPFRWYGSCKDYAAHLELVADKIGKSQVIEWWITTIASHPLAYVEDRGVFSYTLLRHMTPVEIEIPTNSPGIDTSDVQTYGKDMSKIFIPWSPGIKFLPVSLLEHTLINRIFLLLSPLVCLLALLFEIRNKNALSVAAISGALGFGNYVMLAILGIAADGRYLLASFVCAFVCLILLVSRAQFNERLREIFRSVISRRGRASQPGGANGIKKI